MTIISNYIEKPNGETIEIRSIEQTYCPVCGSKLVPHGYCLRKLILSNETKMFTLRVSFCRGCGRSHRELPDCMIPYKRHCTETCAKIYELPPEKLDCDIDEKTIRTVRSWLTKFLAFAAIVCGVSEHNDITAVVNEKEDNILSKLTYYVRVIVNANMWMFSVLPLGYY